MGITKGYAHLCQPVQVRGDCLRMTTQWLDPVVHVVYGNKQNVGFLGLSLRVKDKNGGNQGKGSGDSFFHWKLLI